MNEVDALVGASVKRLRLQAGWEAARFAAVTNLSTFELSAVEAGLRRLGAIEMFRVLHALGITARDLFDDLGGDPATTHRDPPAQRPT